MRKTALSMFEDALVREGYKWITYPFGSSLVWPGTDLEIDSNRLRNLAQDATLLTYRVGRDLLEGIANAYGKLTSKEREDLTQGHNTRLAKILLLAIAAERIDRQWNAEAIKQDVKRVRRILKARQ